MAILGFSCVLRREIWCSHAGDHRGCRGKNLNHRERQQRNGSDRGLVELGVESMRYFRLWRAWTALMLCLCSI